MQTFYATADVFGDRIKGTAHDRLLWSLVPGRCLRRAVLTSRGVSTVTVHTNSKRQRPVSVLQVFRSHSQQHTQDHSPRVLFTAAFLGILLKLGLYIVARSHMTTQQVLNTEGRGTLAPPCMEHRRTRSNEQELKMTQEAVVAYLSFTALNVAVGDVTQKENDTGRRWH
jgi:hypothetical protein